MTREQLDKANDFAKRIDRLQRVLNGFRAAAVNMDVSLQRMTSFSIVDDTCGSKLHENINQGELLFLIDAYEQEIQRLEVEISNI